MNDHLLVFVPGIFGTELVYHGSDEFGDFVTETVWGENLASLIDTLTSSPQRLNPDIPLSPGRILRKIYLWRGIPVRTLYGPLLTFFERNGFIDGDTLLQFPYDWRQSNINTAKLLAATVDRYLGSRFKRITFVAHSMGGLIVRLACTMSAVIQNKTTAVIQIGTPVRGSSRALYALKVKPKISYLEPLMALTRAIHPQTFLRLMETLNRFPSLFELLPPDNEQILLDPFETSYSALNSALWPAKTVNDLEAIKDVHRAIRNCDVACIYSLFSSDIQTDSYYRVAARTLDITNLLWPARGDGTVSVGSAILGTPEENCRRIIGKVTHDSLPSNKRVLSYLKEKLK